MNRRQMLAGVTTLSHSAVLTGMPIAALAQTALLEAAESGSAAAYPALKRLLQSAVDAHGITRVQSAVRSIHPEVTRLRTTGYATGGDGGDASYNRVDIEPSHAGKFRSADRYVSNGTIDPTNGGWWELTSERGGINVLQLGAKGDGATDDTAAINDALGLGYDVHIPSKTFLVDALTGIIPANNQKITLAKNAVLQAAANSSATVYHVIKILDRTDVTLEGGTIIGERATHTGSTGESGMGVYVANSTNVTLRDIESKDNWGDGIYVGGTGTTGQSANVVVDNCVCTNNRRNNLTVAAVDGCRIIGGKFTNANGTAPEYGIDVEPNPGKPDCKNVIVMGATCTGNTQAGIGVSTTLASNIKLIDNTCNSNGTHGIVSGYTGSNLTIRGNTCNRNTQNGIFVFGAATYTTNDITVEGNTCKSNVESGIRFEERCARFKVRGNLVELNGLHGMILDGMTGWVEDGIIEENIWHSNSQATHDTYDNIRINAACRFLRIADNICRKGAGAHQPKYGINVLANEPHQIVDNDLHTGGGTANYSGVFPDIVIQRNIGFKTENRVLSPTFAVDAVATVTVTIPHGLDYKPAAHHCQLSLVDEAGIGFSVGNVLIQGADETNVTAQVKVTTAAGEGSTARLALAVERPSTL